MLLSPSQRGASASVIGQHWESIVKKSSICCSVRNLLSMASAKNWRPCCAVHSPFRTFKTAPAQYPQGKFSQMGFRHLWFSESQLKVLMNHSFSSLCDGPPSPL